MGNKFLAEQVRNRRLQKGFSQEQLSAETGVSLRTIQRVEKGKTEPRGDTLKLLAAALDIAPEDLTRRRAVVDNKSYLLSLNLSALMMLFFPVLGILVPVIIWLPKKDIVRGARQTGKELLNFQITWVLCILIGYAAFFIWVFEKLNSAGDTHVDGQVFGIYAYFGFLYLYNIIFILINTRRIYVGRAVWYVPRIQFIG